MQIAKQGLSSGSLGGNGRCHCGRGSRWFRGVLRYWGLLLTPRQEPQQGKQYKGRSLLHGLAS